MRAPTGTKLEVPIPKVVSWISPETLCFVFLFYWFANPDSGPQLSNQIPDLPEEHQRPNRCPASKQTLRQLPSSGPAGPATWGYFAECRGGCIRWCRKGYHPPVSGLSLSQSKQQVYTASHEGHMDISFCNGRTQRNSCIWMWVFLQRIGRHSLCTEFILFHLWSNIHLWFHISSSSARHIKRNRSNSTAHQR